MNKFLPNLLLVFSMALCGMCVWQWVREGKLTSEKINLHQQIYTNKVVIQGHEANIKKLHSDVDRLEKVRAELNDTIKTNTTTIKALEGLADKLTKETQVQQETIETYKGALETANERITSQNEDIKKQNDLIKEVAQQRDDKVGELNKMVEEYNKMVKDYNKVVEDMDKLVAQFQEYQKQVEENMKKR